MLQTGINLGRQAPSIFPTNTYRQTFADQLLHPDRSLGGLPGGPRHYYQPTRGFGMDLDGDGRFDSKNDGFLTFDFNRDGQHTDHEIQRSRDILKAFSGNFDTNNDGRTDFNEFWQGYSNFFQARSLDYDRDGVLSTWELQRVGGSVVTQNSDGSGWNSRRLTDLPGGRRLESLNPWNGTYSSSFRGFGLPLPSAQHPS